MIFLVDMDGPLAGFNEHFFLRCGERGYELDCTLADQTHKFATSHIKDVTVRAAARSMVYEDGWFAQLPVVPGAVQGMNALAEIGDVWICTKPLEANRTCRDDKARWIVEYLGVEWERKIIIAPDKSMVVGNILLDDGPHLEWYERATWHPVIFDAPFNRTGQWADDDRWKWGDSVSDLAALSSPWSPPSKWQEGT